MNVEHTYICLLGTRLSGLPKMLRSRYRRRPALSGAAVALILIVIVSVLAVYALYASAPDPRPVHYVPYVVDQKLNQSTAYNYWNLAGDSVIVGLVSVGLAACTTETLGACAASSPAIAGVINDALQDTIVTVTANFEFANEGNGTASHLTYGVAVYSDGTLVTKNYYDVGSLAAGSAVVIPYHYDIKLADLPTAIWNYIQGKGQIDIELVNVTYGGRT